MFSLPIYNIEGNEVGKIDLDKDIFDGKVNQALLYQSILMYQARRRKGTASTKTRGETRGGGKKPWRQKGTGRARVSSIRSPIWRGGGTTFGPHPRDYSYTLPKKMKRLAIKSGLNDKLNEDNIILVDNIKISDHKTKKFYGIFNKLRSCFRVKKSKKESKESKKEIKKVKDNNRYLLLLKDIDNNISLSSRNIPLVSLKRISDVNVLDILTAHKLIVSKDALDFITEKLKI